ncbi:MAG: hypothetical protein ACR2K3_10910, partial [Nocardioides sp.]
MLVGRGSHDLLPPCPLGRRARRLLAWAHLLLNNGRKVTAAVTHLPPKRCWGGMMGYNALKGTFLGGCLFSGRVAGWPGGPRRRRRVRASVTSVVGMTRTWRPAWPCPVERILGQQRHGGGDPTYRLDAGAVWRGLRTPTGPATLRVLPRSSAGEVEAEAWGDGAEWVLDHVPALLGNDDDVSAFETRHPVVAESWRRNPHWRFGATHLVLDVLVPAIIEQKVTGQEAFAGFRHLVHRYGERAPGPGADLKLWVQPSPATLRGVPSWEWLRMHIDPA